MQLNKRNIRFYLACYWAVVSTVFLFWSCFFEVPTANAARVDSVQTFMLATLVASIISFYFGDSEKESSKNNDNG